ncbi:MAG: nucleotidyl transferase AbiEii/AbiGii toxin family protein [Chloroflexota bacterium]|nr:nucleotidyl transferase AbiEii/AbiGii toxin family protein [Chloroflexota bacterium]
MLDFEQVKAQYPQPLQQYERGILREYLQYKILQGIFESRYASEVAFMGGTALRIVYGNTRFSEDIDLDNLGLNWDQFDALVETVNRFLLLEGFETELRKVEKVAYHCTIRFPAILYENGISPLPDEKIRIQIDSFAQGYDYQPDLRILNKFDVFTEVRVTPLAVLLSQKIYAAANRKRPKGRDFYDITFLLSLTRPDFGYLTQKMGSGTPEQLREHFLEVTADNDFEALARDVAPFLIRREDEKRVLMFRAFWEQAALG